MLRGLKIEARMEQGQEPTQPRKSRRRWGEETEAGKQLLQEAQREVTPEPGSQEDGQQNQKKQRKSRWEQGPEVPAAAPTTAPTVPGMLTLSLPPSLAHLINFDPESLELNRQLNIVS